MEPLSLSDILQINTYLQTRSFPHIINIKPIPSLFKFLQKLDKIGCKTYGYSPHLPTFYNYPATFPGAFPWTPDSSAAVQAAF